MSIKTLDNVSRKSAGVYTPQRLDTENLILVIKEFLHFKLKMLRRKPLIFFL
jgi:hypothetical protein